MRTLRAFIKKAEVEDALANMERAFRFYRRNLRALLRAVESEESLEKLCDTLRGDEVGAEEDGEGQPDVSQ